MECFTLPAGNWTLNPGAITGSTKCITISGLAPGTYNYTVTNAAGCISMASANVVINLPMVSSNPDLMKNKVKIYPNPINDVIRVSTDSYEKPLLKLYSINGVLLKEIEDSEMNVNNVPVGTYVLKVKLDGYTINYPVIISK